MEIGNVRTIRLDETPNAVVIGKSSVIGKRAEQQDSIMAGEGDSYLERKTIMATLCDGMGGLNGGAVASQICTSGIYQEFLNCNDWNDIPQFYRSSIVKMDMDIHNLKDPGGAPMRAGTTLVSVIIKEDELYWASVGDSHIYIIRGQEMLCIVQEHNYKMILDEQVSRGEITVQQACENPNKDALISYIGMGGVRHIDLNVKPFQLLPGDYIVLCSDGLYRTVEEEDMKQIICSYGDDVQGASEYLTDYAMGKGYAHQDNTSVIIVQYLGAM